MSDLEIRTFVAPAFGQNAYLVWKRGDNWAIAIDPGGVADAMATLLAREGLFLEAILLTHAHIDHIEGVATLVGRTGASIHLHPEDRPLSDRAADQGGMFGMRVDAQPPIDHDLVHGQTLTFGGTTFEVRHVPGHSPGHVILYVATEGVAFVGDVIFQSSIGRTDLPGGDFGQLIKGIREQVFTLPSDTKLFTGHGPPTEVGHERATNPFLVPQYGGGLA
jgi:glyoxylase-like metal-dependent hydrolase (beta-lactamase superfamily II)